VNVTADDDGLESSSTSGLDSIVSCMGRGIGPRRGGPAGICLGVVSIGCGGEKSVHTAAMSRLSRI
jgi:hypothetical protein